MACYYIIKSPDGGEDIKIPANFGLITETPKIKELIDNLRSLSEEEVANKQKEIEMLQFALSLEVPHQLNKNILNNIVTKFANNPEKIIPELNQKIQELGNYSTINSSIIKYIGADKDNFSKLKEKLNKKITPKYFKGISSEGILEAHNLKDISNNLKSRILENAEVGFSLTIPSNLNEFLIEVGKSKLNPDFKQWFKTNSFLNTPSTFGTRALNIDNLTLLDVEDDLSVFLGVFKRAASYVDSQELYSILTDFNSMSRVKKYKPLDLPTIEEFDVQKFFNGTIKNDQLTISLFDYILDVKDQDFSKPFITRILKLVANTINPKSQGLFKNMQTLFQALDPEKYGKDAVTNELLKEQFSNNEIKFGIDYNNKIKSNFLKSIWEKRDEYFAEKEVITSNLYDEVIEKIAVNRDIVKFTNVKKINNSNIDIFGVVTGIYHRKDGVYITGVYENQFGEPEVLKKYFKEGDKIEYRVREDVKDPYNQYEDIQPNKEGTYIKIESGFPQKIIKDLLSKGDIINGGYTVTGIYPGYVTTKSESRNLVIFGYSKIKSFTSIKAKDLININKNINLKKYHPLNDGNLLSVGDLFFDEEISQHKRILYTTKDNLYSYVGEGLIKAYPRDSIKKGSIYVYGKLTKNEMDKIDEEYRNIGHRSATMSSFMDPSLAKEGDYFIIEGSTRIIGKVIDPKTRKGIYLENSKLAPIIYKSPLFFTSRDISTVYATSIARVNDFKIHTLSEKTVEEAKGKFEKAKYVISKEAESLPLFLLPSGYANVGRFVYLKHDEAANNEIDITKKIKKLREEAGDNVANLDFYMEYEFQNSGKYAKNLYLLHKIIKFNKLLRETRKELDVFKPGVYFSLKGDFMIYEIISVKDGVISAHFNKISQLGKMLTTEIQINENSFLDLDIIDALYLQYGNNNFQPIIQAIKDPNLENVQNRKAKDNLIKKMSDVFSKLNIGVKTGENFESGQKAKIESIVVNDTLKTSIILNKDSGLLSDLIHETLHIYLTALRYVDPTLYSKFISSVVKEDFDNLNISDREELFVDTISKSMDRGEDLLVDNLSEFSSILEKAIQIINPDFTVEEETPTGSVYDLLNTPLYKAFGINLKDNSHPLYNTSLIQAEPMMREWMKNNDITLKCN